MKVFQIAVGFAFLPILWLVNIFWFFREAFLSCTTPEQQQLKKCEEFGAYLLVMFSINISDVIFSALGALVWSVIFVTWVSLYQSYRLEWLPWSDDITLVFPAGRL